MAISLRARLFIAYLLVVATALVVLTSVAARQERAWLVRRGGEDLLRAARHALAELQREPTVPRDPTRTAAALAQGLGHRVTLIDSTGRVLGDTEVPRDRLSSVENHAGREEVAAALAGRVGRAVRTSATVGRPFLYLAVPTPKSSGLAVLRLAEPLSEIDRLGAAQLRLLIAAAVLTLLLVGGVIYWVTGRHASRVTELERVAARLGRGELRARARELPADELGRLGAAMNRMAGELRARLEALERERNEREQILGHMTDGVALLDASGRIVHANRSLATVLGQPLAPAPGTPFSQFARAPELEELIGSTRRDEGPIERELRLWTPEPRTIHATALRLTRADSEQVLVVLHDLTEAERLNRVREDFVANVSHELKTPLTSVRGYAETLLEGGFGDLEHRETFARVIRDQAKRLEGLVNDLLSLAELERPDARLTLEKMDLRDEVGRQVATFNERAARAGLVLGLLPGPPLPVVADRARIAQVMANLLDNAIKYTERGSVQVSCGADEHHAWCEVRDSGAGIPEEDLPRVFERFYRVDKGRSREKGGTGLGLSIVKHILALHGGLITVRSRLGEGSTFRFEIPNRSPRGGVHPA